MVRRAGAVAGAGWLAGLPFALGVAAHGAVPPGAPDALAIALGWTFEPLVALAAPVTQLLRVASPGVRQRWIMPLLHSPVVAAVGHPVVAAVAFTTVLWASHFSPLFDLALEDRFVHDLEHALYLGAALLF